MYLLDNETGGAKTGSGGSGSGLAWSSRSVPEGRLASLLPVLTEGGWKLSKDRTLAMVLD